MDAKIHQNIRYRVIEAVITVAASITQYAILTRYLSQQEVGQYSLLLACMFFLNAFSYLFGTMSVVTRDITQGKDAKRVVSSGFILQLCIAVVLACVFLPLIGTLDYFSAIRDGLFVVATVFLVLVAPFSFQAILSARQEMGKIACINSISQLVSLGFLVACVLTGSSLFFIYLAYMSLNVVQVLLTLLLSRWKNYFALQSFHLSEALSIVKEGTPIVLMMVVTHLYVRIDVFMVDLYQGKEQVAQYSAAYNLLDYMMILSNTIMTAVFPNFTGLALKDSKKFKFLYKRIIQIFAIFLVPIAILIAVFSQNVLSLIYGASYSTASNALVILMIATIFAWLNGPSGTVFIAYKKQNIYAWGCFLSLLVNVVGNFILIPLLGYDGAAISTVLTEVALVSFCLFNIYRMIGYVPFFTKLEE